MGKDELARVRQIDRDKIYAHIHRAKQRLVKQLEGFRDSPVRQSTVGDLDAWLESLHAVAPTVPAKPKANDDDR